MASNGTTGHEMEGHISPSHTEMLDFDDDTLKGGQNVMPVALHAEM